MAEHAAQVNELLEWYDSNRRILPWREDPTPYHVWLSEIMLQQTRVEAGKAYYLRFLEELPDIASLAAAQEEVYLKLWEGLGYYSRVRNLHKAAEKIMEDFGDRMPKEAGELEKLPGIGPYSAAAISSIAFGQPAVALDGNLLRVYARMTECAEESKSPKARKEALAYYEERIGAAGKRPGDFNQALMDLGAGVCLPNGEPLCGKCPWEARCLSHSEGREQEFPVVSPQKTRRKEKRTVLILRAGDRIALRRRPEKGLLAGLYEFPNVEGHCRGKDLPRIMRQLLSQEVPEGAVRRLPSARHVFSHIEWVMQGYEIRLPSVCEAEDVIWATQEELERKYSVPSAFDAYKPASAAAGSPDSSETQA